MLINFGRAASCSAVAIAVALATAPAHAQVDGGVDAIALEEVVVTARKRSESDIAVPVAITALSAEQIERNAVTNIYDIAQITPSVMVNTTGSGIGGGVFLRGIGTAASTTNSLDQAVSFDIDGVPISRGNVLRVGEYDLQQIEILKGPQALFFGKNSPAGVMAFKSKDPTAAFETMVKLSYEPFAQHRFAEAVVSGPITDVLLGRLFVRGAESEGADKNLAAQALPANFIRPNSVFAPTHTRVRGFEDFFVRGTLLFSPNERLTARLKASYNKMESEGVGTVKERYYCPQGQAQNRTAAILLGAGPNVDALANALSVDDCRVNGTFYQGNINPALILAPGMPSQQPEGLQESEITLGSFDVTYQLTDALTLSAVTGFAHFMEPNYDQFSYGTPSVAALSFHTNLGYRQWTQEVRLQSDLTGPFNFMVGGFYQDSELRTYTRNFSVPPFNIFQYVIPNTVKSGFAQVMWDITDTIELAGGARYTEEEKELTLLRDNVLQPTANPSATFTDTSPEVTLTWRPSSDLTAFVAYRTGFKSGGYAATISGNAPPLPTTEPLRDFLYEPESAEGFEFGLKAQLLDRRLRVDTSIYSYEYGDLQVSNVNTSTGAPILRVFNAATAKQEGVEITASYYPPLDGLRLHGTVNYNDSHYTEFESPCYIGQSIAEGCNLNPTATGAFTAQDLSGRQFTNAPLWTGSLGFFYERPVAFGMLSFGADAIYKSSYNATAELSPGGHQEESTVFNAQVSIEAEDRAWQAGIYAKNLTDVRRILETSNAPLTGSSAATGTAAGGVLARADLSGNPTPGRAVFFQLTVRPSAWLDR